MTEDLEQAISYLFQESERAAKRAATAIRLGQSESALHRFSQFTYKAEVLRHAAEAIQTRAWERKCSTR